MTQDEVVVWDDSQDHPIVGRTPLHPLDTPNMLPVSSSCSSMPPPSSAVGRRLSTLPVLEESAKHNQGRPDSNCSKHSNDEVDEMFAELGCDVAEMEWGMEKVRARRARGASEVLALDWHRRCTAVAGGAGVSNHELLLFTWRRRLIAEEGQDA